QKRVSAETGEEVSYDDIVKGYEIAPDQYVTITPDELETLDPKKTKSIDIEDFVDLDQIDPVYYERSYYLVPDAGGAKAYALLVQAMKESGMVAIARMVLRTKQYLVALRAVDDVLVIETLYYNDEVIDPDELEGVPHDVDVSDRELKIARQLIESLATEFEPERYRDEYRERVLDLIEKEAEGQRLKLSNLDKVFYPKTGFTKGQVIDYYTRVSEALLPHLNKRPLTLKRYPNGVDEKYFYEKRCPTHRPAWVATAPVPSDRHGGPIDYCLCNDLPTLVWVANMASIELHPSLSHAPKIAQPTTLAFDLDPGPPAAILECAQVALWVRDVLGQLGVESLPKTSGSKGMQ